MHSTTHFIEHLALGTNEVEHPDGPKPMSCVTIGSNDRLKDVGVVMIQFISQYTRLLEVILNLVVQLDVCGPQAILECLYFFCLITCTLLNFVFFLKCDSL